MVLRVLSSKFEIAKLLTEIFSERSNLDDTFYLLSVLDLN